MLKDDFEIISLPKDNFRALEILFDLIARKDSLPLSEIKERTRIGDNFFALISTASDLTTLDSRTLYRKKDNADATKISIWLSSVLQKARREVLLHSGINFRGFDVEDLRRIAKLSSDESSLTRIREILIQELGVVLVVEKSFKSMKLDGVATILSNGIPVIGISARFPRYDYFWFTLLHELSHILLHYDQLTSTIYDDFESEELSDIEIEANRLASDSLVPRMIWNKASVHRSLSDTDLLIAAKQAEVHPAVVAGLLRKRNNDYRIFSKFINQIDIRKAFELA